MRTLTLEPLLAPSAWITLALGGAGVLSWYGWWLLRASRGRRRLGIMALMAASGALVLAILLNPTWVIRIPPPGGKPVVTVLVDASASMATPDASSGRTRFQEAAESARRIADRLGPACEVRHKTFEAATIAVDPDRLGTMAPLGRTTDLAAAIAQGIEPDCPQGQALVLLSDGIHNALGGSPKVLEAARTAKSLDVPIYVRAIGQQTSVRDMALELVSSQQLAVIGQKVPIRALVRHAELAGRRVQVSLRKGEAVVAEQAVVLPDLGAAQVEFVVDSERAGITHYQLHASPLPGEASAANNAGAFLLRVLDRPIRVLVLEGKPYWDGKFLVRTLSLDPSIELDSVVRLATGRFALRSIVARRADDQGLAASRPADASPPSAANPVPTKGVETPAAAEEEPLPRVQRWDMLRDGHRVLGRLEDLRRYQILVLGRDAEVFLDGAALGNVRQWISREGGSLVCYRGSPAVQANQDLDRLLPVRWAPDHETRFHVSMTHQGRNLHWLPATAFPASSDLLARLPTLASTTRIEQVKPLAVVLASNQADGSERPVITYQPYGTGRSVVIEGAGMWRWAFLPPRYQEYGVVYGSIWQSLLRWLVSSVQLMPGQKVALHSDKVSFLPSEPAAAVLLVHETWRDKVPTVRLASPSLPEARSVNPVPVDDEPGIFRVPFGKLPEGVYEAEVEISGAEIAARTLFEVRDDQAEGLDVSARPELLARLASLTGGRVIEGEIDVGQEFLGHLAASRPERIRREPAWDRWWVLVGILALWTTAWAVRRSSGLV